MSKDMKVNTPHRHLRRSRIKRLMDAGWSPYGNAYHWKNNFRLSLIVTMPRALELQSGWNAKRKAEVA